MTPRMAAWWLLLQAAAVAAGVAAGISAFRAVVT